ncbi:MAG: carboxypeptidase-like regulatory domain-containing protein [Gemmatimonadetes bacterium]|nr:carboxypeptidase-like regulatory domain-containing protein [Gemmatimonadota bacterium]
MSPGSICRVVGRTALNPLLAAALLIGTVHAPAAAQTGTVTGTVRSATNGQPIPGAQVAIPELNVGILANNVGRYLLNNVPAGTHTVEVQYIGYSAVSAEVTVTAGQAAVQDFDLRSEAISLEGVVVTTIH